ncbi:MAG: pyridoxamine 5'-phosphate oxidase family protein [Sulfurimonas sp.]|nr:pyridoxamine 5'-phosphate oxidase family protein [Sulfurimonas sp.]
MMDIELFKISTFINKHHVMSLATSDYKTQSVCSLFYAYNRDVNSFIVASNEDTTHMSHIAQNNNISGNIYLETKMVGKVQGVQFNGVFMELEDRDLEYCYFKKFPYALALSPKLWQIKVNHFKMTDNTLGFGKKIIWEATS